MNERVIFYRNKIVGGVYVGLLKPIFFNFDPEAVHDLMLKVGGWLGKYKISRELTKIFFGYKNPILLQNISGMQFENPIGLAAGFDKNAELTQILPSVGFGFMETGSITGHPCSGNPKPRLWRLPKSKGLVVYYGLKNDGCEAISKKLSEENSEIPLGINVAMTNSEANLIVENAISDFAKAFKVMEPYASYITVNISCPNTVGGQPFMEPKNLNSLLDALDSIETDKPIFVKLTPDLTLPEIDTILETIKIHRVHGIICSNLTKKRDNFDILDNDIPKVGGISGKPVQELSDKMLSYVYKKEGNRFILIGCGGVFSAEDAYRKIRLGASLIQIITGMIFEGPQVISEINQGLAELLKKDGYKNIGEAVGADN